MSSLVGYEQEGPLAIIELRRPDALNALSAPLVADLATALRTADADPAVRAVVLTGAGRGFCAGADVGRIAGLAAGRRTAAETFEMITATHMPLLDALLGGATPIVAALNGPCAGAGVGMALGCDLRVASDAAFLDFAFIRRALVPDYGTTYWLPRMVGEAQSMELCLRGARLPAEEAAGLGLVNRVVPAEDLLAEAKDVAFALAAAPTGAVRATRALLRRTGELRDALQAEFRAQAECLVGDDARESAAAFRERRAPRFHADA